MDGARGRRPCVVTEFSLILFCRVPLFRIVNKGEEVRRCKLIGSHLCVCIGQQLNSACPDPAEIERLSPHIQSHWHGG